MQHIDALIDKFYSSKPKVLWRMSKKIRSTIGQWKADNGAYLLYIANDEELKPFTLLGHPIQIIEEDKLILLYVFANGAVEMFDMTDVLKETTNAKR